MTITLSSFFWLLVVGLLVGITLELRKQKILRTLAGNLVTIQVKNEDTSTKLVDLCVRTAGVHDSLLELLKSIAPVTEDNDRIEALSNMVTSLRERLMKVSDRQEQSKAILEAFVDEAVQDVMHDLESRILAKVESTAKKPNPMEYLLEQIQKADVKQVIETAEKVGYSIPTLQGLSGLMSNIRVLSDLIGQQQPNGTPSKN